MSAAKAAYRAAYSALRYQNTKDDSGADSYFERHYHRFDYSRDGNLELLHLPSWAVGAAYQSWLSSRWDLMKWEQRLLRAERYLDQFQAKKHERILQKSIIRQKLYGGLKTEGAL